MNKQFEAPKFALPAEQLVRAIEFFPKNYIWAVHSGLISPTEGVAMALVGFSSISMDYGVLHLNGGNVSVYNYDPDGGDLSYWEAEWYHTEKCWVRSIESPDDSDIWIEQYWRPGESPVEKKEWSEWRI